jgi:flagellar hook-basal body complex protein FliE
MAVNALSSIGTLPRLQPLVAAAAPTDGAAPPATGFATVLNGLLAGNQQANATADAAIRDLATGDAQDLHTVTLAVAQADLSFRLILELRNRLSDAFQEVSRMQI